MEQHWDEKLRIFLTEHLLSGICGLTLGDWLTLLWKHQFSIDLPYWPRAAFMTGVSLINSPLRWYEDRTYSAKVRDVQIKSPLFILGHWRSGTTLLQNLLASDQQFAYVNAYQALNPHTFLSTERYAKNLGFLSPHTRVVDNMHLGFDVPFDDEYAICSATSHSPQMGWAFPRSEDHYDRYLTLGTIPSKEIVEWKTALVLFYKKLTWKYQRPLLLKSPPFTCRIKLLLELFPDARFIHIHRNPYTIFQSTKRLMEFMFRITALQRPDLQQLDTRIIRRHQIMYDCFFAERGLIPGGWFCEVCFEELEQDPVGQVKKIYEKLNLDGFDAIRSPLQQYVDSIANYRKNEHVELPSSLRRHIAQAWQRSFEEWQYPYD